MWYQLIRPILFALDAELSHDLTLSVLQSAAKLHLLPKRKTDTHAGVSCFGLNFPNPVGLAAGLDKNANCLSAWEALGFGFIEVGTVTPKPQPGNPKPRLFRLSASQAIVNRMGFNNKGIEYLIERLKSHTRVCPIGVNIGKNKDTSLEQASQDYLYCFQQVYPYADYVTVNLSSPNTPGLRTLQEEASLKNILSPLLQAREVLSQQYQKHVPLLVKIAPDLSFEAIKQLVGVLLDLKIDGIIATNTTIERKGVLAEKYSNETGGLSGAPLFTLATEIVRQIYQQAGDVLPIIAVGGIMNAQQAQEKLKAGAKLVQLYTGLIYRGASLISEISNQI